MKNYFLSLSEAVVTLCMLLAAAIAAVLMVGHILWKWVSPEYEKR